MKRILVTGSRTWVDAHLIRDTLTALYAEHPDAVLVHGSAAGADSIADAEWRALGGEVERHPADWLTYGRRAGLVRNKQMVDAGADVVLAFIRDRSRGATMCAGLAEQADIPVQRYEVNE